MDKSIARQCDPAPIRLKVFRIRHGLTQSDFGAKIQADKADISRYENSVALPSLKTAGRIEILTGIPCLAWLDPDEIAAWIDEAEIAQDLTETPPPAGSAAVEVEREAGAA